MTLIGRMHEFEADTKWIGKHYEELRHTYPNEWIAVQNGVVIKHCKDQQTLLKILKKTFPNDYKQIPTEYISTENTLFAL